MFATYFFQRKHVLVVLANGGSSARGGYQCARRQHGTRQRCTEGGCGGGTGGGVQKTGGWRLEVTGVHAGCAELVGNVELGGGAQGPGGGGTGNGGAEGG
jgi:hypothetical protein